jgi:hypothetical protein
MTDAQNAALVTATNNVTAAMDTLAVTTLPSLVAALAAQRQAIDPAFPVTGRMTNAQGALYSALVRYVNQAYRRDEQIAAGGAMAPFPYP